MAISRINPIISGATTPEIITAGSAAGWGETTPVYYYQFSDISNTKVIDSLFSTGRWKVNITTTGVFASTVINFSGTSDNLDVKVTASNTDTEFFITFTPESASLLVGSTGTGTYTIQFSKISTGLFSKQTVTLDSITNTSTYNQTGYGIVAVVGGGGGGGGQSIDDYRHGGGAGGGAGYLTKRYVELNGSIPVVIGAGGVVGNSQAAGNSGGSTSFGDITANGGLGGGGGGFGAPVGGIGSSQGGRGGGGGGHPVGPALPGSTDGALSSIPINPIRNSGSSGTAPGGAGGIYASGAGSNTLGRGGGGGGGVAASGNNGGPGAVYVLRWD